jgi:hypothetical protein
MAKVSIADAARILVLLIQSLLLILALVLCITTVVRIIRFPWQNVLNISIADVGDGEYDSAVFLLQGSFQVGTRISDALAPNAQVRT